MLKNNVYEINSFEEDFDKLEGIKHILNKNNFKNKAE
jgi:hypothetical protein